MPSTAALQLTHVDHAPCDMHKQAQGALVGGRKQALHSSPRGRIVPSRLHPSRWVALVPQHNPTLLRCNKDSHSQQDARTFDHCSLVYQLALRVVAMIPSIPSTLCTWSLFFFFAHLHTFLPCTCRMAVCICEEVHSWCIVYHARCHAKEQQHPNSWAHSWAPNGGNFTIM
jgi:hypothetical protein